VTAARQGDLFGVSPARVALTPQRRAEVDEAARRATAGDRILERLQAGPATNVELAAIALRYSARIFDLRAEGYSITASSRGEHGIVVYTLEESNGR
jgi:hypothetical protein